MKIYIFFSILVFSFTKCISQTSFYNIYEVNKGEILQGQYFNIQHLFNNYYSATKYSDSIKDFRWADMTGIIDDKENLIIPFNYRNIFFLEDLYHENDKYKLIRVSDVKNRNGLILYKYDSITGFNKMTDGYMNYKHFVFDNSVITAYNGYYNFFNVINNKIIRTNCVEIEPLNSQFVAGKDMSYKWGIFDKNNTKIYDHKYDYIERLSDSLIVFTKNDSMGVINYNGEIIIPCKFKKIRTNGDLIFAETFNNGKPIKMSDNIVKMKSDSELTISSKNKSQKYYSANFNNIQQVGLSGVFNANGVPITEFKYVIIEKGIEKNVIVSEKNKFGIISNQGKLILDTKYDEINTYFNKFYVTKVLNKFGILDQDLNVINHTNLNKVVPISEKKILILENLQWYILTINDSITIDKTKIEFDNKTSFELINSYSKRKNEYINSSNYIKIKQNGKVGIMSKNLEIIIPPIYTNILYNEDNLYFEVLMLNNKTYFNLEGKMIENINDINSNMNYNMNKYIICKRGNKYGVIDINSNVIIPFIYNEIKNVDEIKFIVKK